MTTEIELPDDLRERVSRDFGDQSSLVTGQLIAFRAESPSIATDRILRCIVQAAASDVGRVRTYIDLAKLDWRDLIMAAEYQYPNVRVLDLSHPFEL